jgi:hypothetical protein
MLWLYFYSQNARDWKRIQGTKTIKKVEIIRMIKMFPVLFAAMNLSPVMPGSYNLSSYVCFLLLTEPGVLRQSILCGIAI